MAAYAMAREANTKPIVILVIGRKGMPNFRRRGYTRRSIMGMKIMMVSGSMFCIISLGMPWSSIVAACETKLFSIWL